MASDGTGGPWIPRELTLSPECKYSFRVNLWPGNEGYPPPLGRICGGGMRSLQALLGVGEVGAALAWPLGNGVTTEGRGFREPP